MDEVIRKHHGQVFHVTLKNKKKHISFCKDPRPGNLKKTKITEMLAEENGGEEQSLNKVPVLHFVSGEPKTKTISESHSEPLRSSKRARRHSGTRNTC